MSYEKMTEVYNVPYSTIASVLKHYAQTGTLQPGKQGGSVSMLSSSHLQLLYDVVMEDPGRYLEEHRDAFFIATGGEFFLSIPVLWRSMKRVGLSRKKLHLVAKQQDAFTQALYLHAFKQVVTHINQVVFADETGADLRTAERLYGYTLRGFPAYRRLPYRYKGRRYSSLAGICSVGVAALSVFSGGVNAHDFIDFLQHQLLPVMQPYPAERSVLVVDNATIHHVAAVQAMCNARGVVLLFLPPYSPELNPIEEVFATVKQWLRRHSDAVNACHLTYGDLEPVLFQAFASLPPESIMNYIRHAYANMYR
jgi:transposase